ncbi:RagB/SusD family nutrient uptake outer membrane protein [Chryseolinea soli]|uniref:RagB/SusD family nutrient uptake outer membrane protein n=1 Tax=Chryseolinea soli TaxID=2321403 RepID=A0A385SL39_9BACT|nr:RagB/SusD family nutrient uptake outer membrane protein [Chryseolinea soli]AYB31959.1 RagB/SusD family nutrient uptake outer membrane protein [Chryseolinea soli]
MKTLNNHILAVLLILISATSCDLDKLDVAPLDKLSSSGFWKTESDVQASLTANYAFLKNNSAAVSLFFPAGWDALSDDGYNQYPWDGQLTEISTSGPTPNTGGYVYNTYNICYQAIAAVNDLLYHVKDIPMEESNRNKYIGEAKFLRAYFYFYLAQLYGNVVIMTEPATTSFREPKAKSTRAEVLALINADLEDAVSKLPDQAYGDGHAVKASAQGFQARVFLYQGKWPDAAAAAKAVIDGGKASLADDFNAIFYKPGQSNNPEILFSIKNLPPNSYPTQGIDLVIGNWQAFQPTKDLIDEYEGADGLPIATSAVYDPLNPYENRDPRLRQSFFFPGDDASKGWMQYNSQPVFIGGSNANTTGFAIKKMLDPAQNNPGYSTISSQDLVLLRYAEVLLTYAEAENENIGPANAYGAINEIRARAGMPELPLGLTKDEMRNHIRHERRVELAFEGLRYMDLRRWGIAMDKLNGFENVPGNTNVKKKVYNPKFDFWPIPQADIDRSKGVLIQNDNY